ncbi:MAG TPA: FliM/FliN family flagellar motor switch protein, partial [Vicinamibacterales bacterium]|nr:FliM/FliN family flagellar motor switch protein [Vicinamibacterales bacterium]
MTPTPKPSPAMFVDELVAVLAAVLEAQTSVQPAAAPPGSGWLVTVTTTEGARGTLRLHVERAGLEQIVKRATGQQTEPSAEETTRALEDWCRDAATAFAQRSELSSARLVVSAAIEAGTLEHPDATFDVGIGELTLRVAIAGRIDATDPQEAASSSRQPASNLDVILDIDLPLVVRFGRTEMTLKALAALGPGSVIDLGRAPEDPVDVLVSNQLVARGEVVIVAGSYGVRVTDVVNPTERTR